MDSTPFALYHGMAAENLHKGRYAEALDQLDLALSVNPVSGEAQFLRGLCLKHMGRLQEAWEAMQAATEAGHPQAPVHAATYKERLETNTRWVQACLPDWFGYEGGWIRWLLDRIMDLLTK